MNKKTLGYVLFALGIATFILALIVSRPKESEEPNGDASCANTACHGLEPVCGKPIPDQVCTLEFRLEDNCMKYASCGVTPAGCAVEKAPAWQTCADCVLSCKQDADSFNCVDKCLSSRGLR